ncbi:MAG: multidrug ABC transporter, partial [Rhodospirillaceae bacterium TMED256]
MSDQTAAPPEPKNRLAVVGSQTSQDEIIFGRAFDKWVIKRFLRHLAPYKLRIAIGIFAVLVYTVTQLSIPLIVRATIDHSLAPEVANQEALHNLVTLFFGIVIVNYLANHFMETIVGRTAQYLLFNLRHAMYEHLQHVS